MSICPIHCENKNDFLCDMRDLWSLQDIITHQNRSQPIFSQRVEYYLTLRLSSIICYEMLKNGHSLFQQFWTKHVYLHIQASKCPLFLYPEQLQE